MASCEESPIKMVPTTELARQVELFTAEPAQNVGIWSWESCNLFPDKEWTDVFSPILDFSILEFLNTLSFQRLRPWANKWGMYILYFFLIVCINFHPKLAVLINKTNETLQIK